LTSVDVAFAGEQVIRGHSTVHDAITELTGVASSPMRRGVVPILFLLGCAVGDESATSGFTTFVSTGVSGEESETGGDTAGESSGDGDGTTGDGDGTTGDGTVGDGDGTTTGDGDGTSGDGDAS
jgi:hypothetical protein